MDYQEELIKLYELHLSILTQWGIDHLSAVEGATDMLISDLDNETSLTDADRRKLTQIANQSSKEYLKMIRNTMDERRAFIDRHRNK